MRIVILGIAALSLLAAPPGLSGVARAQATRLDELVDSDPFGNDPIGLDPITDVSRVPGPPPPPPEETAREIAARGPRPPSVRPVEGEALTAISGVREALHEVHVTLDDGLADVRVAMRFTSGARHPAEVRYRLAVPADATLADLTVCAAERCRDSLVVDDAVAYDEAVRARGSAAARPVAHAEVVDDARGRAIVVRAAPVWRGEDLTLRVRYLASAPIRGGVARFVLPARGHDPRAAPATVTVRADGLVGTSIDGVPSDAPQESEAWHDVRVAARLPTLAPTDATLARVRCGASTCGRVHVVAGPREAPPLDLVIALDVSPSMEGPARGRVAAALAAVLATLPRGSRVRALTFAARAEALVDAWTNPDDVPLAPLARAATTTLGSATRFEEAWALAEPWLRDVESARRRRVLLVVGDGGLSRSERARRAFGAAREARVEVSVLDVGDREVWPDLRDGVRATRGVAIRAGAEAEEASRGRDGAKLEERVLSIFAEPLAASVEVRVGRRTHRLGPLRAGESLERELVLESPRERVAVTGLGARPRVAPVDDAIARALAQRATGALVALSAVDPEDLAPTAANEPACIDERGPSTRRSGVSSDARPIALVEARACGAPRPAEPSPTASGAPSASGAAGASAEGRGIPRETVLAMLRQRVHPIARRCFRRDRAGRGDYSVRAELTVRLADREVVEAGVTGDITSELATCLESAMHALDIPRFSGAVLVRYPLYTEREPPPPVIELAPEVAREVDHIVETEP